MEAVVVGSASNTGHFKLVLKRCNSLGGHNSHNSLGDSLVQVPVNYIQRRGL